ncbi:hypothetical protein THAOC_07543 [Thalassiosira oceanica]|uniref:MYND-type domain-containing protein n=1 Tax=Thalassiosira oceanica TaxID=159749 RepID=K0SX95_THAOC|nr:hypothetical protein THAOC_07543 [Thalassiosira oceanica]|eukprot:EJK71048.1 hypothetical protein THAOC_07543 [Thalassiosira oceanica]
MSSRATKGVTLRFKVGDRVSCVFGSHLSRQTGTVVKLNYKEEGRDPQTEDLYLIEAPYQIRLDSGRYCMAPFDDDGTISSASNSPHFCAGCGIASKSDGKDLKMCACRVVMYCGKACQKAHRSQHKEECRMMIQVAHNDKLFAKPPPPEDCHICCHRLPLEESQSTYHNCCGKRICNGCLFANSLRNIEFGEDPCPFCRSVDNSTKAMMLRMEKKDGRAFHIMGTQHFVGGSGFKKDLNKAYEYWTKGAEYGSAECHASIGGFHFGEGGPSAFDAKKARTHFELAAMQGNVGARHNLGMMELNAGKSATAMKHFLISASVGNEASLDMVKQGYPRKDVRKADYESCLKAYHESVQDLKTDERLASKLFYSGDSDACSTAIIKLLAKSYDGDPRSAIRALQEKIKRYDAIMRSG